MLSEFKKYFTLVRHLENPRLARIVVSGKMYTGLHREYISTDHSLETIDSRDVSLMKHFSLVRYGAPSKPFSR